MRKHKFTVPLLTEMNPIEHTQSNSEGTTRTLGLNRNQGEVIELRLRTDAYDGYRDYKTIRKTLCHELAHNVWGPHDRNFWDLCKQIEKEVAAADWRSGGHTVSAEEYYGGSHSEDDEVHDHGGWTGGEFVLGVSSAGGAESTGQVPSQMSRREILAKAAEERLKSARGEDDSEKYVDAKDIQEQKADNHKAEWEVTLGYEAYVGNVTKRVRTRELRAALAAYGRIIALSINRMEVSTVLFIAIKSAILFLLETRHSRSVEEYHD